MFDTLFTRRIAFLITAIWMGLAPPVQADVYKWKDSNNRTHFSDQKPRYLDIAPLRLKINAYQSVSYGAHNTSPVESNADKNSNKSGSRKVMMYSTDWCGYCKKARRYFTQQSIPFTEYDIEKNARAGSIQPTGCHRGAGDTGQQKTLERL